MGAASGRGAPLEPMKVDLAPDGTEPVPVVEIAEEVRDAFAAEAVKMIDPEGPRKLEESGVKAYEDPVLKGKKVRVALAARLWRSGMLIAMATMAAAVCLFSVVKAAEGNVVTSSRLVFDFRGINLFGSGTTWVVAELLTLLRASRGGR